MYIWTNPFLILFLILPPIAIVYDWKAKSRVELQTLFYWYIAAGYILINISLHYSQYRLGAYLQALENPPPELTVRWEADGAANLFCFVFGWVYALVYFSVWRLVYFIIKKCKP